MLVREIAFFTIRDDAAKYIVQNLGQGEDEGPSWLENRPHLLSWPVILTGNMWKDKNEEPSDLVELIAEEEGGRVSYSRFTSRVSLCREIGRIPEDILDRLWVGEEGGTRPLCWASESA